MANIISELPCFVEIASRNIGGQNQYMLAVGGGNKTGGAINSNASEIGETEQFSLFFEERADGVLTARIQTCYGTFLRIKKYDRDIDAQNSKPIHVDAVNPSSWEQFTLCALDSGKFAFRTYNNHYLTAQNSNPGADPVMELASAQNDGSWFTIVPQFYHQPMELPRNRQRGYEIATTNLEATKCFVEEWAYALREMPISAINPLTEHGKLHIQTYPNCIVGVFIEFPELNYMLGEGGVEEDFTDEIVLELSPPPEDKGAREIGQVIAVTCGDQLVGITLNTRSGKEICSFLCPIYKYTDQELQGTLYKVFEPFSIVGLIPGLERGHNGGIKNLELLCCTEEDPADQKVFSVLQYTSDSFMSLRVKGEAGAPYCNIQRMTYHPDGSIQAQPEEQTEMDSAYVYEISILEQNAAMQIYGALTTAADQVDFPEGAFLEVISEENEYLDAAFNDDHFVVTRKGSLWCFADHKPEQGVFTVIAERAKGVKLCLELQMIADHINEAEELQNMQKQTPKLLSECDASYPPFRGPLYKIALLLGDEDQGGRTQRDAAIWGGIGLAGQINGLFHIGYGASCTLACCTVAAAVVLAAVGCVYLGIQIYNRTSTGREKIALKNLCGAIEWKKKIIDEAIKNYQQDSQTPPNKRKDPIALEMDDLPREYNCGVVVFWQSEKIDGKSDPKCSIKESQKNVYKQVLQQSLEDFSKLIRYHTNQYIRFNVDETGIFQNSQKSNVLWCDAPIGEDFVKIFRGNIFRIFASKLAVLTSSSIKRFILAFRKPFRWGISFSKRVKFFISGSQWLSSGSS